MKIMFGVVALFEVVAILVSLRVVLPGYSNSAVLVAAIGAVGLITVGKRLRKKRACCA